MLHFLKAGEGVGGFWLVFLSHFEIFRISFFICDCSRPQKLDEKLKILVIYNFEGTIMLFFMP